MYITHIYIYVYMYIYIYMYISNEVYDFHCLLRFAHSAFAAGSTAQVAQGMLEGCCTQGRAVVGLWKVSCFFSPL